LFAQILDIVEQRRETSSSATYLFLKSVLAADKVPSPGEFIRIKTLSPTKNEPDEYTLARDDTDYEYLDYVRYSILTSRFERQTNKQTNKQTYKRTQSNSDTISPSAGFIYGVI
jgi:hypothetical protein